MLARATLAAEGNTVRAWSRLRLVSRLWHSALAGACSPSGMLTTLMSTPKAHQQRRSIASLGISRIRQQQNIAAAKQNDQPAQSDEE